MLVVLKTLYTCVVFSTAVYAISPYRNSPNFSVTPTTVELSGEGGSFEFRITAVGSSLYSISSDVDWLTIMNPTTSGSAIVTAIADKGTTKERIGHIIVSESVTYKGTTITLRNKIEVRQDLSGMSIGLGGWNESGEDQGGEAV